MTRFVTVSRATAIAILIVLATLTALGLPAARDLRPLRPIGGSADLSFYRQIVDRMRKGAPYERTAVTAQRAANYPLRPFLTVRPPLLATLLSRLPDEAAGDLAMKALGLAVVMAWAWRLRGIRPGAPWRIGTALVVFAGVSVTLMGQGVSLMHEAWAGLLISLSLALRTEKHFALAVVFGLAAALIRELAMPFLGVMSLLAARERRWTEAAAFALALVMSLAALGMHAQAVIAQTTAQDSASPSWLAFGGWPFVLVASSWMLMVVPWIGAAVVPGALLGAAAWRDSEGSRLFALLTGYTLGFTVIGRPENFYWGLVTAPLLAVGICFAPMALADLVGRATRAGAASAS